MKKLKNLKLFRLPKHTISKQRNFGANNTSAKHILFLDADGQLKDPDTLKKYMDEVERRKPDIAAALNHPLSDYWKDRVFFKGMNLIFRAIKPFWPMATGMNLYIRRDVFEKVKGFDEMVRVGEDIELVQRVVKKGGQYGRVNAVNRPVCLAVYFFNNTVFIGCIRKGFADIYISKQ